MADQTDNHQGNCFKDFRFLPFPTPPGSRSSSYPAPQLLENLPLRTAKGSSDIPFVRDYGQEASPIEYSSGSESFPLRNAESQQAAMSRNRGSRFPSALPAALPAAAATTTAQPQPSLIRTQFEQVTAHTAKCDLCNARNDSGMSRCSSCGWQSCHTCTIKNGCTRTHNAGSRVHTGPIHQNELFQSKTSPKDKKKRGKCSSKVTKNQKGSVRCRSGRGREPAQTPRTQSQARTQRGQRQGACTARTPSPSISPTPRAIISPPLSLSTDSNDRQSDSALLLDNSTFSPSTTTDVDDVEAETDKDLSCARNLYAFSLEAHGAWIQEEREKDPVRRWYYQTFGLGDLHGYAQNQAARAVEEFRRREVVENDRGRFGRFEGGLLGCGLL